MAKRIEPRYECIAYLSVEADLNVVDRLEDKQLKYIKEYAKAHNIKVVGVMRRHGFCMNDVFRNFKQIALLIGKKRVQGVIVAGMKYVSSDIEDAYSKIGMVKAAGTPYYNKATQEGMYLSFTAIADASTKPCILYNVPSRTGCNLLPATVARLAEHPNIVGIKEASGNISQIAELARLCAGKIAIYSGNDDQIIPIMSLGGVGVISVLSNLLPSEVSRMCRLFSEGDITAARDMQLHYLPLTDALFSEVNPIPVKAAMAAMGFGENYLRLPLTPMSKEKKDALLSLMRAEGLI